MPFALQFSDGRRCRQGQACQIGAVLRSSSHWEGERIPEEGHQTEFQVNSSTVSERLVCRRLSSAERLQCVRLLLSASSELQFSEAFCFQEVKKESGW